MTAAGRTQAFEFTTRRPVAILMSALAVAVFGLVSYARLPLSLMPDLTYPTLTVRTEYPGSAPGEVETAVSRPIEREVGVVANLVRISSISRAGLSDVVLEFAWGTDMDLATQEVRERLDQVFLPDEASRPLILRYDPALDPVVRLALHGERDLYFLRRYAEEELSRELETLPGVAAVKVKGGLREEIRVDLDERKLAALGLDIGAVGRRLALANVNLAGGNLEEGRTAYVVRTLNEFRTVEEIGAIVVAEEGGAVVRVRDVASVRRGHADRDVISRVNGQQSVEIAVYKEADANIVAVAEAVRARVFGTPEQRSYAARLQRQTAAASPQGDPRAARQQRLQEARLRQQMTDFIAYHLPPGVSITLLADQSTFIRRALAEVRSTALWGGVLAILVLYMFLRRVVPTLIIAVAIPVSIVATFAPMYLADVSLNVMSLGGLALGIGMLVDNSVVVLESIARCREEGDDRVQAVIRGTGEVGGAVVASTLTTVAVFAPIVFVEGVAGQVFGDLALTIVFALLTSLAVALFLVPMLASRSALGGGGATTGEPCRGQPPATTGLPVYLRRGAGALAAAGLVAGKGTILALLLLLSPLWGWRRAWRAAVRRFAASPAVLGWEPGSELRPGCLSFHLPAATGRRHRGPAAAALLPLRALGGLYRWLVRLPLQVLLTGIGRSLLCLGAAGLLAAALLAAATAAALRLLAAPALHLFDRAFGAVRRAYRATLTVSLAHPLATVGCVAALSAGVLVPAVPRLGRELIPPVRQGIFDVVVRLPVGTPVEATDAALRPLEAAIRSLPGVETVAMTVGVDREEYDPNPEAGEHSGTLTVRLARASTPVVVEDALIEQLRRRLRGLPGLEAKVQRPALFSTRTPIEVEVRADDLEVLRRVSAAVASRLGELSELRDVRSSLQRGHPEIRIAYDRQRLMRYGLELADVAALVRNKVQGEVATEFRRGDRRVDIRVRLRPEDRATLEDLRGLVVNPGGPHPIRLESVATLEVAEGPSEIRRIDQQRAAVIGANTTVDLATATAVIERELRRIDLPGAYSFAITGQRQEMERSTASLLFALGLAVFLVYVVMASQFESLLHPFVILFSIPLAAVGVVAALWILQISLSVVVLLGCVVLAGIVVNNAIVLVDYINHLRRTGLGKIEAVVQAATVRLRPILITATTTIIGLLPMAVAASDGAEIRAPMAVTVIAGLLASTLLTLVVVPVVYTLVDPRR